MKTYNIAILPCDGIGREVMPPALDVPAQMVARHPAIAVRNDHIDNRS